MTLIVDAVHTLIVFVFQQYDIDKEELTLFLTAH